MSTDLLPLLSDTDRDLHEVSVYALESPEPICVFPCDEDRAVDLGGDDYDWDAQ